MIAPPGNCELGERDVRDRRGADDAEVELDLVVEERIGRAGVGEVLRDERGLAGVGLLRERHVEDARGVARAAVVGEGDRRAGVGHERRQVEAEERSCLGLEVVAQHERRGVDRLAREGTDRRIDDRRVDRLCPRVGVHDGPAVGGELGRSRPLVVGGASDRERSSGAERERDSQRARVSTGSASVIASRKTLSNDGLHRRRSRLVLNVPIRISVAPRSADVVRSGAVDRGQCTPIVPDTVTCAVRRTHARRGLGIMMNVRCQCADLRSLVRRGEGARRASPMSTASSVAAVYTLAPTYLRDAP